MGGLGSPRGQLQCVSVCVHACVSMCKRVQAHVRAKPAEPAGCCSGGSGSSLLCPPALPGLAGEDLVSTGEGSPQGKPVPQALGELEGHWGKPGP